jgi:hypothetical protein
MIRTTRLVAVGAAIIVAGVLLAPVSPVRVGAPAEAVTKSSLDLFVAQTQADGSTVDYLPVNSKGVSKVEMKDDRTILTFPMIELATGNVVGTIIDDIKAPIPGILFDVTTTYKFADGEIVNHMFVSSAPDVQRPGWIIVGNRPNKDTIVNGTGVFAGRTGRVRLSGTNDLTKFPEEVYQDDLWVIELNR